MFCFVNILDLVHKRDQLIFLRINAHTLKMYFSLLEMTRKEDEDARVKKGNLKKTAISLVRVRSHSVEGCASRIIKIYKQIILRQLKML